MPFIYKELGGMDIYFHGSEEQAISGFGEPRSVENYFVDLGRNVIFLSRSRKLRAPPPYR